MDSFHYYVITPKCMCWTSVYPPVLSSVDPKEPEGISALIAGGWRGNEWANRKQEKLQVLRASTVYPALGFCSPITSSNLNLLIKSTLPFYPLHSILTPSSLRHCPGHPITFEGSWEHGSAPALTCLDTTGSLFCPHGGEEEDGGVWLKRWGGYACRLKVRVGGLAMSVREETAETRGHPADPQCSESWEAHIHSE